MIKIPKCNDCKHSKVCAVSKKVTTKEIMDILKDNNIEESFLNFEITCTEYDEKEAIKRWNM